MTESWRPILDFDGYEISSLGRVRGKDRRDAAGRHWRGKILKPQRNKSGGWHVRLYRDGRPTTLMAHKLAAEAFKIGGQPSAE